MQQNEVKSNAIDDHPCRSNNIQLQVYEYNKKNYESTKSYIFDTGNISYPPRLQPK
jgi:hypothetical protein